MSSPKRISVDGAELMNAFHFVSTGAPFENSAYISIETGQIYWSSTFTETGLEEDLPDDLEDETRYIEIPNTVRLDLGRTLALSFVLQELSDDYQAARDHFRRRGVYARFKALLQSRGMLEKWFEFEERETAAALRAWCEDNDIEVIGELR